MKVGVVASDVPSCEFYRAAAAAKAMASTGELEYVRLDQTLRVRYANRRHGRPQPIGLIEVPDIDVAVFVRGVFSERMHDIVGFLQREGVAVVVDFDDAYDRLPSQLHNRYRIEPRMNPYYNWRHAIEAAKLADVVTVSTPSLQRYRADSVVVRNCVPESYLDVTRRGDGLTVGWSGAVLGHPGDLRVCGSGVAEALRRTGARFLNVGDGVDVKLDLGLDDEPEATGIVPLADYPRHIARIDVAIAPLVLNAYVEAKSALKPLEALAVGSCYVASPSSEYGRLQSTLEQWCALSDSPVPGALAPPRGRMWLREVLKALQRPEDEREEASAAARQFVRETHTIESHAYLWADAWELAIKRRKEQTNGRR